MLTTGKGKGKWVQSSRSKLKMSTNLNVNGCGPLVAGGLDRSNMEDVSMGRYGSDVGIQFLGLEGLARVLANVSKNVKPIVRSHAGFESQDQVNTSNDQVERDGDDLAKRVEVDYRENVANSSSIKKMFGWSLDEEFTKVLETGVAEGYDFNFKDKKLVDVLAAKDSSSKKWNLDVELAKSD
ncbi:hypothetical protein LWI28_008475 [Acer negundo]|uniref:Uncharacterized protein n=1 Tax=Acer negundo TaxID=4023 RepID=A0AAD5NDN0_ACENE|nr:hypothetical protein LWI28_008475 [Acer negundo]